MSVPGNPVRQVALGILAAITSIVVVLGSLLLAFAEGGEGEAFVRTPKMTSTSTELPVRTPLTTLRPDQQSTLQVYTATLVASPTETSACPMPAGWLAVTVQPGETLESLAQTYGISLQRLMEANCLLTNRIQAGILIYVPAPPAATPTPTEALTPTETAVPCGAPSDWVSYRVKSGDTLYSLATATGTTVPALQFANCMGASTRLLAGQIIYLPKLPPTATPQATASLTATPTLPTPISITFTPSTTSTSTPPSSPTSTPTATPTTTPSATATSTATLLPTPSPTETSSPTP